MISVRKYYPIKPLSGKSLKIVEDNRRTFIGYWVRIKSYRQVQL